MINDKKCIILIGSICSGKTECLNMLQSLDYVGVDMGGFIKDFFRLQDIRRLERIETINKKIETIGRNSFIRSFINHISKLLCDDARGYVICGMRNSLDLDLLIKQLNNYDLVHVFADQSIRFNRTIKRNRSGDPRSFEEFIKIDDQEMKFGLSEILKNRNFDIIYNQQDIVYLRDILKSRYGA